jgi:hypothetical protein
MLPLRTMLSPTDPLIQKIRQMCTKDKVVQSLYQRTISWSDVPSDDEMLEMDDWKAYEKIEARAKEAYRHHHAAQKVYTIPQRSKKKKHAQVATRIPYATLKQRSEAPMKEPVTKEPVMKELNMKEPVMKEPVMKEPVTKELNTKEPVTKELNTKEIVEEIVHQSPVEYEELEVVHSCELPPVMIAMHATNVPMHATHVPKIVPTKMISAKIIPKIEVNTISFPSFYQYVILSLITILIYYVNKSK